MRVKHKKSKHKNKTRPAADGSSKAHLRYWKKAIFQRRAGGNWWAQIQHRGLQKKVSLWTPIKSAAASRARDFYHTLVAKGWEHALAELRPQTAERSSDATVGDFLAELKAKAVLKSKTLEGYAKAFRKIVSDIFELGDGNSKCDYRGGGYQVWVNKVHAIKLVELTPERVQAWKRGS